LKGASEEEKHWSMEGSGDNFSKALESVFQGKATALYRMRLSCALIKLRQYSPIITLWLKGTEHCGHLLFTCVI
jgi:hypothetical protein